MNYVELLSSLALGLANEDFQARLDSTVEVLREGLGADSARLFMLQLSIGGYQERAKSPRGVAAPMERELKILAFATETQNLVRDGENVAIPISRDRNVPVCVLLTGVTNFSYWSGLEAALAPLANLQLDRRAARVLKNLRSDFDYRLADGEFYKSLGDTVLESSGMRFGALRFLRGARLDCVAAWGFATTPDLTDLSFNRSGHREFELAASGEIVTASNLQQSGSRSLLSVPDLQLVKAFVAVPVQVRGETIGVLTLATSTEYWFARSEIDAFEAVGRTVGSAISSYRSGGSDLTLPQLSELSMRSTIEMIAASSRHAGLQIVHEAITQIGRARSEKVESKRIEHLKDAESTLSGMSFLFDRMKLVLQPPRYEWTFSSINSVWKSVVKQFNAKIDLLKIDVQSPTAEYKTYMYPDWIKAVFLQFLINSVDAFEGKGFGMNRPPASGRQIRLDIDRVSDTQLRLRYTDNAGGINPAMIKGRDGDEELSLAERIFQPEASTKDADGTGWGLPLVRKAIAEHGGSVYLADTNRRGVTFDILLPTHDADSSER